MPKPYSYHVPKEPVTCEYCKFGCLADYRKAIYVCFQPVKHLLEANPNDLIRDPSVTANQKLREIQSQLLQKLEQDPGIQVDHRGTCKHASRIK